MTKHEIALLVTRVLGGIATFRGALNAISGLSGFVLTLGVDQDAMSTLVRARNITLIMSGLELVLGLLILAKARSIARWLGSE